MKSPPSAMYNDVVQAVPPTTPDTADRQSEREGEENREKIPKIRFSFYFLSPTHGCFRSYFKTHTQRDGSQTVYPPQMGVEMDKSANDLSPPSLLATHGRAKAVSCVTRTG